MKWDNKDHHPFPGNTEKAKFEPKMLDCCPGWGKEDAAIVLAGEALTGALKLWKGTFLSSGRGPTHLRIPQAGDAS